MNVPKRLSIVVQPQAWTFDATDSMPLLEAALV